MIRKFDSATPLVVHALTKCLCTTHAITVESMCASIIIDLYKQSAMIINDLAMSRPPPTKPPTQIQIRHCIKIFGYSTVQHFRGNRAICFEDYL